MTTKRIIVMIVSVVIVLGLVVILFVGGIVGFALYQIGNSEAAKTAKTFLKNSDRLKQDIGEVKDFGTFVTGNININNGEGTARLSLKVIGERKTVKASVDLMSRRGGDWRVVGAFYRNDRGEVISLFDAYESRRLIWKLAA
jgi:hypothetical protein